MKKILLSTAVLLSSLSAFAQYDSFSATSDIDDLALIYIGGQQRPDWNKDLFEPYVVHTYADGTRSWMFDGFLMIEFAAYNDARGGVMVSFGETGDWAIDSRREDWERLINVQMGTYDGNGCRALDNLIDELIPELGEPGHKHKVVFSLPVAESKTDYWGEIDGKKLYFSNIADRITAMKWYSDYIDELWKAAGFKHLEYDGIYWTGESFTGSDKNMISQINEYYKAKGLNSYWIPYLTRTKSDGTGDLKPTQSADSWKEVGVDQAYVQPNYYFNAAVQHKYLEQTVDYAYNHNVGLEVEFEGYNYTWNPQTHVRTRVTPANCGLYGHSPAFYQRFVDYIDYFEEMGVFDFMPIAYYCGYQGVYDFEKSGNPKDKEIMDRLATILNSRHCYTGWDVEPRMTGIDEIQLPDRVLAYGVEGAIYIADEISSSAEIYTLDGRMLCNIPADKLHYGATIACEPGIYIVKAANRSIKVAVK